MKRSLECPTFCVFMAFVALTVVFSVSQASEPDHQTINNIHKHENQGKGVLLGMLLACRLNATRAALFEGRWWTWCGEQKTYLVDNELSK